jgi:hypothetical protein
MTNNSNQAGDVVRISTARTCLPVARAGVWSAIQNLATQLWNTHVVLSQPTHLLIHSVSADHSDDPDGWLTWSLDALSAHDTAVTVSFSEQHDGAPPPEPDLLLCHLIAEALGRTGARTETADEAATGKDLR